MGWEPALTQCPWFIRRQHTSRVVSDAHSIVCVANELSTSALTSHRTQHTDRTETKATCNQQRSRRFFSSTTQTQVRTQSGTHLTDTDQCCPDCLTVLEAEFA